MPFYMQNWLLTVRIIIFFCQYSCTLFPIVDHKQKDLTSSKEKEQQFLAELNTAKQISQAKDQEILVLEKKLQAKHLMMSSPSDQFGQQQKELEMRHEKIKAGVTKQLKGSEKVCVLIMGELHASIDYIYTKPISMEIQTSKHVNTSVQTDTPAVVDEQIRLIPMSGV